MVTKGMKKMRAAAQRPRVLLLCSCYEDYIICYGGIGGVIRKLHDKQNMVKFIKFYYEHLEKDGLLQEESLNWVKKVIVNKARFHNRQDDWNDVNVG